MSSLILRTKGETETDVILESIMLEMLCIAMFILICRFAKNKSTHLRAERAVAWAMGVGFALGVVNTVLCRCSVFLHRSNRSERKEEENPA